MIKNIKVLLIVLFLFFGIRQYILYNDFIGTIFLLLIFFSILKTGAKE
jgi:hypothetical protein